MRCSAPVFQNQTRGDPVCDWVAALMFLHMFYLHLGADLLTAIKIKLRLCILASTPNNAA
jgi:hypothetical protein